MNNEKLDSNTLTRDCKSIGIDEKDYRSKALQVWGNIPYDVIWAINTQVYKQLNQS